MLVSIIFLIFIIREAKRMSIDRIHYWDMVHIGIALCVVLIFSSLLDYVCLYGILK